MLKNKFVLLKIVNINAFQLIFMPFFNLVLYWRMVIKDEDRSNLRGLSMTKNIANDASVMLYFENQLVSARILNV